LQPLDLRGYVFSDTGLLETALTHRSTGRHNNERLEFLGDAILGFVITEALYKIFPGEAEGILTRLRASLVKKETLADLARKLHIGSHVVLGPGERKSGGWRRDSILANTLESLIGAIYLDSGMPECRAFILALYDELLDQLSVADTGKDPKTVLQELLQARKLPLPVYHVVAEQGEAHRKVFTVTCEIAGLAALVTADGLSKRAAEQAAASEALKLISDKPDDRQA
jgi:ribonuclease-3